jgi:hypothetical protein
VEGWPLVSAHTPGEWVVDDDRKGRTLMVLARDGGMAIIVNEVGRPATKTDRANACLIAQAPPLLRELRIAVQFCGCTVAERESGHRIDCWAPSALDVIEKAEGRQ